MPIRDQWIAIAAGTLLLAGNPTFEIGRGLLAAREQALFRARDPAATLRGRMVAVLLNTNPNLGPVTATRIANAVLRCGEESALPPELVMAVMLVESSARPSARSDKGAVGLMQVMPYMFEELPLPGSVAHIEANIEAGCLLLADNIGRLGEEDGISAYFWGRRIQGKGYLRRVRTVLRDLALQPPAPPLRGCG
jgi:soluble lytic murein transglycosylase-like protein